MYKATAWVILVTFLSLKQCSTQVLQFGVCGEVETMKYFNLEKFLGKWYEIERFRTWYEEYGNCAYKIINQCGRVIEIEHGFIMNGIHYILHVNSTYNPGDEAVFNIKKNNIDPIGMPLSIITTDYNNYAVVYGCRDSDIVGISIRYVSAWILSRQPFLSEEILEQAHQVLHSLPNASTAYLEPVLQTEESCKYSWTAHVNAEDRETDEDKEGSDDENKAKN